MLQNDAREKAEGGKAATRGLSRPYIAELTNKAASSYLLGGKPDAALRLLDEAPHRDSATSPIVVTAELLANGPAAAWRRVDSLGVDPVRVTMLAANRLYIMGEAQPMIDFLEYRNVGDANTARLVEGARLGLRGAACFDAQTPVERMVWEAISGHGYGYRTPPDAYPEALRTIIGERTVREFDKVRDDTLRRDSLARPMRCIGDVFSIQQVGRLVILEPVRSPVGSVFYEYEGRLLPLYHTPVGTSLRPLVAHFWESGERAEAIGLLRWILTRPRAQNLGLNRFRIPEAFEAEDMPFLSRAVAGFRWDEGRRRGGPRRATSAIQGAALRANPGRHALWADAERVGSTQGIAS